MRAKPILSLTLLAAALGLPGIAGFGRLGANDGSVIAGSTSVGADRAHVPDERGPRFSHRARCRFVALSPERPHLSGRAVARSRLRRAAAQRWRRAPRDHADRRLRAVSRLAGRSELGIGTRRSRLHVPARSAGNARGAGRRARHSGARRRSGASRRRDRLRAPCRKSRRRSHPVARRPARWQAARDGNTYNVRRGDTLSRIAGEVKPANVYARADAGRPLQRQSECVRRRQHESPARRRDSHGSERRAGAASAADEATRTVRMQAADWRSYQDKVAGSGAALRSGGSARCRRQDRHDRRREACRPRNPGRTSSRYRRARVSTAEDIVSRDKALREAQTRINELEKTLQDLQKRTRVEGRQPAAGAPPRRRRQSRRHAAGPATPPPDREGAGAREGRAADNEPARQPPKEPRVEPPKTEPPKVAMAPETKAPEPKAGIPAPVETPKPAVPKPAAPKTDAKAPPAKSTSLFDDLFGSTPGWVIGGGAFAALAGIAALIAARRRRTVKFEDSIIGGTDIKTNTVFGSTGGGVVNTGENSLATDFSREGLGSIDTDEVDPIAEAEVYLAYGRDAQAEEILKDALKKDPQRQEIYLKLLEIHAQHNKPSAFETVAAELYSVSQGKGEAWQKAVTLGRQLDPNNPMFGEGGAAAAAPPQRQPAQALQRPQVPRPSRRRAAAVAGDREADRRRRCARLPLRRGRLDLAHRQHDAAADRCDRRGGARVRGVGEASRNRAVVRRQAEAGGAAVRCRRPAISTSDSIRTRPEPGRRSRQARSSDEPSPALARPAAAIDLDKLDLAFTPENQAFEDPTPSDARRPVARRGDQARSREGVPGNGRRRRRARDPAGSAARRRRHAESRSAGAARQARLTQP